MERLTRSEVELTFDLPAVLVNRCYVDATPVDIKLTLAEGAPGVPPRARACVVMRRGDAIVLRDLLAEALGPAADHLII